MSRNAIKEFIFGEIGGVGKNDQRQADLEAAIQLGYFEESTEKRKGHYLLQPPDDLPF